jgi:hypothetical protein
MPTSDYHQISDVLHVVQQVLPQSVLDVGVGFGKWGVLLRDVLEVYDERLHPESWQTHIDGIEIHEPYRNPLWSSTYNAVHIGDARDLIDRLACYDLILCCDVIEHFPKDEGVGLLRKFLEHAKVVIITAPRGYWPQGASCANIHETHRSGWGRADLKDFPHLYKDIGFTFLAVLANDTGRLRSIRLHQPLEVLGVKRGLVELTHMGIRRLRHRLFRLNGREGAEGCD